MKYIGTIYTAILLVVTIVEDLSDGDEGLTKREDAIRLIKQLITSALGFYPAWLPDVLLGAIIDMVVNLLNKTGVFKHGA